MKAFGGNLVAIFGENKAMLDTCTIWPWCASSRSLKIIFLDRQNMSFYMSLMINEALSLTITEILSFENLQKSPLFSKMHPIQPNEIFSKFPCDIYWPRVRSMLFWKFWSPICYSYGVQVAHFWKICPPPLENDKKFQKTGDGTTFEIKFYVILQVLKQFGDTFCGERKKRKKKRKLEVNLKRPLRQAVKNFIWLNGAYITKKGVFCKFSKLNISVTFNDRASFIITDI